MPSCLSCRASTSSLAKFCSACGKPLAAAPATPSDSIFEAELVRPRRSALPLALAAVSLTAVVGGLALLLLGNRGGDAASAISASRSPTSAPAAEVWAPPPGPRQDVIAIAQTFPNLDEHSLGALFDAKLRPIYGAPNLFTAPLMRRVPRHDMRHSFEKLTEAVQLDVGFRDMLAGLGASWNATSSYQLYRALQIAEVITLDERQAMRRPPDEAVFYLAEIRTGASYDMFVRDTQASQSTFASFQGLTIEDLRSSGRYQVTYRGSGLTPTTGSAVFAMTPDEVARSYAVSGSPVAVELVFRTIPTRTFERKKLPLPRVLIDAAIDLVEGESRFYTLVPGTVALRIGSKPKGVVLAWDKPVQCAEPVDGREQTAFETQCTLTRRTVLTVTNYTQQGKGPIEHASVYLARLPALPQ